MIIIDAVRFVNTRAARISHMLYLIAYNTYSIIAKKIAQVKSLKVSTKGRYALRMLLDLAEHKNDGFIALKDIAKRQDVSKKYLEQIVNLLHHSDILRTNRGPQGGYMLAKDADQYTVGQILRITEGGISPVTCMEDEINQCPRAGYCKTLFVWQGLEDVISQYLDSITLQSILDKYGSAGPDEYYI